LATTELVAEIEWVSSLEERGSGVENDLIRRTSPAEAAFISKRIVEDKMLRATGKAWPKEEEEEEKEAKREGCSDERSEEHDAREVNAKDRGSMLLVGNQSTQRKLAIRTPMGKHKRDSMH